MSIIVIGISINKVFFIYKTLTLLVILNMKNFDQVFSTIESEQNASIRRANKATLFSLVNYLFESHAGISKYNMENFLRDNQFLPIFQQLLSNTIVTEQENGNFILNNDFKDVIPTFLQELSKQVYYGKKNFIQSSELIS